MKKPQPFFSNPSGLRTPIAFDGKMVGIDILPFGVLIADNKMLITYSNHGFSEITGFSESEIIGQTCSFVQGESTNKQTRSEIRVACKNGTTFHGEILNFKKDGTPFWNELTIDPMRNSAGQVEGFIGISRDITKRKSDEIARDAELSILQKHSQAAPAMGYQFRIQPDGSLSFPFIGKASYLIYGLTPDEVKANPSRLFDCVHPDDSKGLWDSVLESKENLTAWIQDYRINLPDQSVRWLHGHSKPERESDGSTLWSGFVEDITQRKNFEEQIKKLAFYDTLTGLANRILFYDRLNQAMIASNRTGHFGAIICIDLDQFKPVNDDYGHAVGDAMLTEVATRLKHCVRGSDTVARFGGDEFVVMLSELSAVHSASLAQAIQVAEKLLAALSAEFSLTFKHNGMPDEIIRPITTASIGVSIFQGNQLDADQILKDADKAMYRAKKQGGGLVRIHK
jgi:diguanylate cyclase (GGDEF)-like protein/PAS domain S-box-containing protein